MKFFSLQNWLFHCRCNPFISACWIAFPKFAPSSKQFKSSQFKSTAVPILGTMVWVIWLVVDSGRLSRGFTKPVAQFHQEHASGARHDIHAIVYAVVWGDVTKLSSCNATHVSITLNKREVNKVQIMTKITWASSFQKTNMRKRICRLSMKIEGFYYLLRIRDQGTFWANPFWSKTTC